MQIDSTDSKHWPDSYALVSYVSDAVADAVNYSVNTNLSHFTCPLH